MKTIANKNLLYIFVILIACCSTFCNTQSEIMTQLLTVEKLFSENNDSVAIELLTKIPSPKDSTQELALYNYLCAKQKIRHHQELSSNYLDFAISHFKNTNDSLRLAYSYNYKSSFLLCENDKTEARRYNIAAEEIGSKLNDNILKYNIYSSGYYIAAYFYDTNECLTYADKAYQVGLKLGDSRRMAHPAIYLTMCYDEKNMPDSVKKYMALCLNFINDYSNPQKSTVYNILGDVLAKSNNEMAEHYYKEAIAIDNNRDAYNGLTRLYLNLNKMQQADSCYRKALRPKAHESNIKLMEIYAHKLEQINDLTRANNIRKEMYITLDSLFHAKTSGLEQRIANHEKNLTQNQILQQAMEDKLLKYRYLLIVTILLLVIVCVKLYIILSKGKQSIATKNIVQDVIEQSEDESIEEICNSDFKQNEQDIEMCIAIYEQIVNNINISQIVKKDKLLFINYYETIDEPFFHDLTSTYYYDRLSVNAIIVLILQHLGKDKQTILDILSLSDQAYRSLKSRIEKTRKQDNENQ